MFLDSKIANKNKSGWTKATHMLTGAVSKQTTDDLEEELSMTCYGIAADGSSDENDKYLPILIRHVGKTSGLIKYHYLTSQTSIVVLLHNKCLMCVMK